MQDRVATICASNVMIFPALLVILVQTVNIWVVLLYGTVIQRKVVLFSDAILIASTFNLREVKVYLSMYLVFSVCQCVLFLASFQSVLIYIA